MRIGIRDPMSGFLHNYDAHSQMVDGETGLGMVDAREIRLDEKHSCPHDEMTVAETTSDSNEIQ